MAFVNIYFHLPRLMTASKQESLAMLVEFFYAVLSNRCRAKRDKIATNSSRAIIQ